MPTAVFIVFAFVAAPFVVLIIGAKRKWTLRRIGAFVFLVLALSNLALLLMRGEPTSLTIYGIIFNGTASLYLFLLEFRQKAEVAAAAQQALEVPEGVLSEEFSAVTDQELVAYVERLTSLQAKRLRRLRLLPLAMVPAMGVVLYGEQLGIPIFVAIVWILVVLVSTIPLMISNWRSEVSQMDAIVELTERGLELPPGTRRVDKAAPATQRKFVAPFVALFGSMMVAFVIIALWMSEVVILTRAFAYLIFAMMFVMFASLGWIIVIIIGAARAQSQARAKDAGGAA